jgi:hypothetical protein
MLEGMHLVGGFLVFALLAFALVDIITRDDWQVKHLPKFGWAVVVIMIPLLGSVLWFAIGREWPSSARRTMSSDPRAWSPIPEQPSSGDHRSTEQQLRDLEREIEEAERRRAERIRLERGDGTADPV